MIAAKRILSFKMFYKYVIVLQSNVPKKYIINLSARESGNIWALRWLAYKIKTYDINTNLYNRLKYVIFEQLLWFVVKLIYTLNSMLNFLIYVFTREFFHGYW